MNQQMTTSELLAQRKLTRAVGEVISERMREYVTTLTPLFSQRAVFGEHIQGVGKESPKNADQAFNELQNLYENIAVAPPFHLPNDLKSPLLQMTSTLQLSPWEYSHTIKTERGSRAITVSSPFKAVVSYAGYAPRRLLQLLADRNRTEAELQQFVLHYLAMHIVVTKQPGVARMLEALHFPIGSGQLPGFGALPITHIASAISTRLPPDALVIESTELSGKDAFEELINASDIEQLRDPLREQLCDIMSANSPVS